ncbi:hypothetical protein GUI12_01625 [Anaplasmataceae bacterium AB001_6]|nr:hypothetical protein GUI12_01625 [Anaplasmataceae bacterium AB001_6]
MSVIRVKMDQTNKDGVDISDVKEINQIILRSSIEFVVREVLYKNAGELTKPKLKGLPIDAGIREKGGVDSLDTIEMIMGIEDKYSIAVPDEVAEKMVNILTIVDYLQDNVAQDSLIASHDDFSDDFFDLLAEKLGYRCPLEKEMKDQNKLLLLSDDQQIETGENCISS